MADLTKTWNRVTCDCGSDLLGKLVHLATKEGGGLVEEPAGYECQHCRQHMDVAYLIKRAEVRRKKREVAALEEEIAAAPAPKPALESVAKR